MELDALYQEYAKLLYHFIYLKCHDRALAEDIVQSTFLKAILQIDSFQGKSKISTWLCEIARNEYLNYCRKHERQQSCDEYVQKSGERPLKQEGFFRDAVLESMIVSIPAAGIRRVFFRRDRRTVPKERYLGEGHLLSGKNKDHRGI